MISWLTRGFFLVYQWQRHYVRGKPLIWWGKLVMFLLIIGVISLFPSLHLLLILSLPLAGLLIFLLWARKRGYVFFSRKEGPLNGIPSLLEHNHRLFLTGWVEVEGQGMWIVQMPAKVEHFQNGEYALLVHQPPARYHLLASMPSERVGMWYRFILPSDIESYARGTLWVNGREIPSIQLVLRGTGPARLLYLCDPTPEGMRGEIS